MSEELKLKFYRIDSAPSGRAYAIKDLRSNKLYRNMDLASTIEKLIDLRGEEFLEEYIKEYNEKVIPSKAINVKIKNKREAIKFIYANLKWKDVFQKSKTTILCNKIHVYGVGFKPVKKDVFIWDGTEYLNLYQPNNLNYDVAPKLDEDSFPNITKLLMNIFGQEQEVYERFIEFLSWKVKYPEKKIQIHWIIQDNGGTGKTSFMAKEILGKLFNISIIGQAELECPFNDYLINTLFVIAEEIEGYDNEKKLKQLTGAHQVPINEKYGSKFVVVDYTNWIFFSNEIRTIKINDRDRRFNIVGGGLRLLPNGKINNNCLFDSKKEGHEFIESFKKNIGVEIKNLFAHLIALKPDKARLWTLLDTKQRKDLIEANKTSEQLFIDELIDEGFKSFISELKKYSKQDFWNSVLKKNDNVYIKTGEIYELFKAYCENNKYKHFTKNSFFQRCPNYDKYNQLFGEDIREGENKICYKQVFIKLEEEN